MDGGVGESVRRASRHASDRWLVAWALGYAAIGAASLLIPLYSLSLGGGPFVTGALDATAGLAGVPGALLWGYLADRTGRRRGFVLLSLAGSGLVLSIVPFVRTLWLLLAINTLLWFLVSASTPVVTLFMIEKAAERDWESRIGALNAFQRYGWVGGLVVGTAWLAVGTRSITQIGAQRWLFVLCALAALAATPLAFYWLPPEATTSARRLGRSPGPMARLVTGSGRYLRLIPFAPARAMVAIRSLGDGAFFARFSAPLRRYFLAALVFSMGAAMFFGPAPAFLTDLAYSGAAIFGFFILASLASAILFVPVGALARDHHPKSLQLSALGIRSLLLPAIGAVALLAGFLGRSVGLGLGFAVLGLTWAVIAVTGAGLVSRSAPRHLRGEALGLFTALSGMGGGVGGLLGGYLALRVGYQVTFLLAGLVVGLSVLVLWRTSFQFKSGRAVE